MEVTCNMYSDDEVVIWINKQRSIHLSLKDSKLLIGALLDKGVEVGAYWFGLDREQKLIDPRIGPGFRK